MAQSLRVPILMFHRIAPKKRDSIVAGQYVSPRQFERHLRVLRRLGFETTPLSELFQPSMEIPRKPIVLTFDDGYEDFFRNALPPLVRAGMRATVFLVANQIGGSNVWDQSAGDVRESLMNLDQIREAAGLGVEFGSHTLDHVDLTAIDPEEAWRQIADSKCSLEEALGSPIRSFCYPYGRKSTEIMRMVQRAGYRMACSTEKGANTPLTDRFALRRVNVRSDTVGPVLLMKLVRSVRNA